MAAVKAPEQQPDRTINVPMPAAFDFLWGPERYLCAWGGRGSGKSINIARVLLVRGLQQKHRILCVRELQGSIKESVHQILKEEIETLGLGWFYTVLETSIRGANGTEFIFKGLRFNASEIKSMQGVTLVWCEEARVISKASWDVLIPTIRTPKSQFFISFNAELEIDDTYQRFVIHSPEDAVVRKVGWQQNPFFPEVLLKDMAALKAKDYDDYLTVWEGHCRQALEGAVYANEIRDLVKEDRITKVPYLPGKPVHTFWDLGYADHTSIWFAQVIGFRYHVIDYYEANRQLTDHYLQALQNRPYTYGTDWLPHDAASNHPGVERTVERQMKDAGRTVRIVPKVSIPDGINAARTIFPVCVFDAEKCKAGIDRLRAYRYGLEERSGRWTKNPVHDQSSHAADAFRYMGVALKGDTEKPKTAKPALRSLRGGGQSWMGI